MREITMEEVVQVSGGLGADDGAAAIIAIGLCGGPFTAALGLTIGLAILLTDKS